MKIDQNQEGATTERKLGKSWKRRVREGKNSQEYGENFLRFDPRGKHERDQQEEES